MVIIGNNLFKAFHRCYTSKPNNADILELVKLYELVSVPSICTYTCIIHGHHDTRPDKDSTPFQKHNTTRLIQLIGQQETYISVIWYISVSLTMRNNYIALGTECTTYSDSCYIT